MQCDSSLFTVSLFENTSLNQKNGTVDCFYQHFKNTLTAGRGQTVNAGNSFVPSSSPEN